MTSSTNKISGIRLLSILVGASIRASFSPFRQFAAQATVMLANNFIFFLTWILFFQAFDDIGGWQLDDIALLFGLVATAHGIMVVVFGSVRDIARRINAGELDVLMTEPPHLLSQLLAAESNPMGWGDIATGIAMLVFWADIGITDVPLVFFCVAASLTVLTSALIAFNSLVFWAGSLEGLTRMYFEFIVTFSTYPGSIFTGAVRFFLFTIVPAGFAGFLPVALLRDPQWWEAAALLGGAAGFAVLALTVFSRGLAHYASGSGFVSRGG